MPSNLILLLSQSVKKTSNILDVVCFTGLCPPPVWLDKRQVGNKTCSNKQEAIKGILADKATLPTPTRSFATIIRFIAITSFL